MTQISRFRNFLKLKGLQGESWTNTQLAEAIAAASSSGPTGLEPPEEINGPPSKKGLGRIGRKQWDSMEDGGKFPATPAEEEIAGGVDKDVDAKDWITLESGTHVFIDGAGEVTAGPAALTGKPISRLGGKKPASKPASKPNSGTKPTKSKSEAIAALDALPPMKGPLTEKDQVSHQHAFIDTDEEAPWGRFPSRQEWEQDSKPATIPIKDLVYPQSTVSEGKVRHLLESGLNLKDTDNAKNGLRVIDYGGKHYLIDGTHRASAAELSGVDALNVRVISIGPKKSRLKGKR